MAAKTRTPRELVDILWSWTSDTEDRVTNDVIRTAAMVDAARALRRIEQAILSLGTDGIHYVLRQQAKKLQTAEKAAATKRRNARKAARAAKLAESTR